MAWIHPKKISINTRCTIVPTKTKPHLFRLTLTSTRETKKSAKKPICHRRCLQRFDERSFPFAQNQTRSHRARQYHVNQLKYGNPSVNFLLFALTLSATATAAEPSLHGLSAKDQPCAEMMHLGESLKGPDRTITWR